MAKKISQKVKNTHVNMLNKFGEQGLYERLVGAGMTQAAKIKHPEITVLNLSDSFYALYRSTGDQNYAIISKALRKAAHTIHRQLKRGGADPLDNKTYKRFLTLCS
jgi:hypothetical protein